MERIREFWKFLQDVWREIHPRRGKVTWPTARAVHTSTLVVIACSVLLSLYISLCDGVLRAVLIRL